MDYWFIDYGTRRVCFLQQFIPTLLLIRLYVWNGDGVKKNEKLVSYKMLHLNDLESANNLGYLKLLHHFKWGTKLDRLIKI